MLGLELHFIAMELRMSCYTSSVYQSHSKEFNITQINVIKM